jgi:hypothetical protein
MQVFVLPAAAQMTGAAERGFASLAALLAYLRRELEGD